MGDSGSMKISVYEILYDEVVIYVDGEKYKRRDTYEVPQLMADVINEYDITEAEVSVKDVSGLQPDTEEAFLDQ